MKASGKKQKQKNAKLIIGWREFVSLPELGIKQIKAKIDTGARTSALHAFDIEMFTRKRVDMVRFKIHPKQRDTHHVIKTEAKLLEMRAVRDSGGRLTWRPVIETAIMIGKFTWTIELTLINRDEMGFRMLLGRLALKGHLLVDPGRSNILGRTL